MYWNQFLNAAVEAFGSGNPEGLEDVAFLCGLSREAMHVMEAWIAKEAELRGMSNPGSPTSAEAVLLIEAFRSYLKELGVL